MEMKKKTVGIIGGMGPAATAELFQKMIDKTDASCDSEHIHILIDNFPQIPDRTKAIQAGSDAPVDFICQAGQRLVQAGAELILIPCNTSHYFYDKIAKVLSVPVVHMIAQTAKVCKDAGYRKVGVLATDGTRSTGIFEAILQKEGVETVYPSKDGQQEVMKVIYEQVKAGKPIDTTGLKRYLHDMQKEGVQAFILGCTELPLALKNGEDGFVFIDTLDVLATVGVLDAGYPLKKEI